MSQKLFVSGDEAVALAAKAAKPHVIAAYPITPQTIIVERLSDFVEDGSLNSEYLYVESEHSAMSACIGAAAMGARTFTATSSQGLLYMVECLPYASGSRFPIVMANANRSIAAPWSIYNDQRDSLSQLECGWIQFYVESSQEAYDMVLQAYKVGEDPDVMLPVMVNLDGFVLTHTYELLQTIDQDKIDAFIPFKPYSNRMNLDSPVSTCITAGPPFNMEFRHQQHVATVNAEKKIEEVTEEFAKISGRHYGGMIEAYKCDDAEAIVVTLGSVSGTTRCVVDELRAEGKKVGLLKIRCMCPFPAAKVVDVLKNAKAVAVLEKDITFGYEGVVYTEVNSAMKKAGLDIPTSNYVGGLGGRSIYKTDIEKIFNGLLDGTAVNGNVEFINLRRDI